MIKTKSVYSLDKSKDLENKILIEKWMKRNATGNMTINKEAVKVANTNINLPKLRNTRSTRNQGNASKEKIIKIQENITFEVPKNKVETNKIIKQPTDIEINFSSKQNKFSRPSLPASFKQSSIGTLTKVSTRKSDTSLQIKKTDKNAANITYSIETIKSPTQNNEIALTKKDGVKQKPKSILKKKSSITYNIETVKKLGNNTKVSPKRQIGLPLNLEKLFKKKPSISFTVDTVKIPKENSNKTKVLNKKSTPNFKPKKHDKRKTNMTYGTVALTASVSNDNNVIVLDKQNNSDSNSYKKAIDKPKPTSKISFTLEVPKSPIKTDAPEAQYELDPKTGIFVCSPKSIPSFSTSDSSINILQNSTVQKSSLQSCIQNSKLSLGMQSKNTICNNGKQESTDIKMSKIFSDLIDTYRYLITPKTWSVMEMTSDTNDSCIVFYNTFVMKEKDVLVSVMKKSLIIDKLGKMHYSVHGLPVDLNTTILPKFLDSTKKLLSILHIFDKMQICEGIGNDLDIIQDEAIFKDTCRLWRHIDCKIILMKTTRCPICTETRDVLLETET